MNVIFLGQRPIAYRCMKSLMERLDRFSMKAVVTGAKDELRTICPGIEVIENEARNEDLILATIARHQVDVLISVQHPWILSGRVLDAVAGRAFNLHNAKLPDYKGHNCISHAILNGDRQYTSTLHRMVEQVDTGEIILEGIVDISPDETAISLYRKSMDACERIFRAFLDLIEQGADVPCRIVGTGGRFYGKGELAALKHIVDPCDLVDMQRKARAFYFPPFEPAYVEIDGSRYYVVPRVE